MGGAQMYVFSFIFTNMIVQRRMHKKQQWEVKKDGSHG
jgi:hypothetical protein